MSFSRGGTNFLGSTGSKNSKVCTYCGVNGQIIEEYYKKYVYFSNHKLYKPYETIVNNTMINIRYDVKEYHHSESTYNRMKFTV